MFYNNCIYVTNVLQLMKKYTKIKVLRISETQQTYLQS